jgi:hypothetical protein
MRTKDNAFDPPEEWRKAYSSPICSHRDPKLDRLVF